MAADLEALMKKIERLDHKLTLYLNDQKKETWVRVNLIQELTGWDRNGMIRARRNNLVKVRKNKQNGFEYCLESIPPMFLKNMNAN